MQVEIALADSVSVDGVFKPSEEETPRRWPQFIVPAAANPTRRDYRRAGLYGGHRTVTVGTAARRSSRGTPARTEREAPFFMTGAVRRSSAGMHPR